MRSRSIMTLIWLAAMSAALSISGCTMGQHTSQQQPVASPTPAPPGAPGTEQSNLAAGQQQPGQPVQQPAGGTAPSSPAGQQPGGVSNVAPQPAAPLPVATPRPPRVYTIPAGTVISVTTSSDLSTKESRSGQAFTASLNQAITDGDWVIAKRGAPVTGVIVTSDPGGKVKGRASISVRLEKLTLADGRTIDLATNTYARQAKGTKKKDAMKIGVGAGIGAAIGAIAGGGKGAAIGAGAGGAAGTGYVLATKGDPAVIPSESTLTFRLTAPVKVTQR